MEEQLITITIKTSGDKCVMTDDQIKEWYESSVWNSCCTMMNMKPEILRNARR